MATDLRSVVLKAAANALKQSGQQAAAPPEPKKPMLSTGKAVLLGAGLATAGRALASTRGRDLMGSVRGRLQEGSDRDQDDYDEEYDEPEAEDDEDFQDEDYDEPEAENDEDFEDEDYDEPEAEDDEDFQDEDYDEPEAEDDEDFEDEDYDEPEAEEDQDEEEGEQERPRRRRRAHSR